MVIDVNQINAEKSNEFEILYNNKKVYTARTPFIELKGVDMLEKLRQIEVYGLDGKAKYTTKYKVLDNMLEEAIPFKYLVTKSQKFDQFIVVDNDTSNDLFSIYFHKKEIFYTNYVISMNGDIYNCYSIGDGYIIHFPIYKDDIQVGEMIKVQVKYDAKDTYRIYLKEEYSYLADSLMMLALYLDRLNYSSSYIKMRGQEIRYTKTFDRTNKYYDKNWIINNFDAKKDFEKINQYIQESKAELKKTASKILSIIGMIWIVVILIAIILLIIFFL